MSFIFVDIKTIVVGWIVFYLHLNILFILITLKEIISLLNINVDIEEFLKDISTIKDKDIFNSGIWNYILINSNYSDDIIYSKDEIKHKSSHSSLFQLFIRSREFV